MYSYDPEFPGREAPSISRSGLPFLKEEVSIFHKVVSTMGELGMESVTVEELSDRVLSSGFPVRENQVVVRIINTTPGFLPNALDKFWDIADPARAYKKDLREEGLPEEQQSALLDEFIKRRARDIKEGKDPFKDF